MNLSRSVEAGPSFDPVTLPEGLDWIMRPVLSGLCRYESLKDGSVSLADLALMNDSLDARDENTRRFNAANRRD